MSRPATRLHDADASDIIGDRPAPAPLDFGLFAPSPATTATIKGGSAVGLERVTPKLSGHRATLYQIYTAHGPCTRNQAAAILCGQDPPTPEAMNTTQGRTAELVKAGFLRISGYDRETGRGLVTITDLRP